MADTLKVRAADPTKPVFQPGHERRRLDADGQDIHVIRGGEWVEVPDTRFYRQRIRMGDLVEFQAFALAEDAKAKAAAEKAKAADHAHAAPAPHAAEEE